MMMAQGMAPAVIAPERAAWLPPISARRYARTNPTTSLSEPPSASWREDRRVAQLKPASGRPVAWFCVALVLWIAPALVVTRIDLRAVEEVVGANPLVHVPIATIGSAFALTYIVATGLLIAATASRLMEGRAFYVKAGFLLIVAPAILVSLLSTFVSSLAFFLGVAIWCFPTLL